MNLGSYIKDEALGEAKGALGLSPLQLVGIGAGGILIMGWTLIGLGMIVAAIIYAIIRRGKKESNPLENYIKGAEFERFESNKAYLRSVSAISRNRHH